MPSQKLVLSHINIVSLHKGFLFQKNFCFEKLGSNLIVKLNFNIMRFRFLMIPLYSKDSIQFNKHLMSH